MRERILTPDMYEPGFPVQIVDVITDTPCPVIGVFHTKTQARGYMVHLRRIGRPVQNYRIHVVPVLKGEERYL